MHPDFHQTGASGIFSCWADGSFKSTDTSTIFVRGAFNRQARNASLNDVQVQLGGSFSIFGANSK
ncbi:hypothetical protein [Mucilaginibacter sp. L3T2-6]|uniref:hypothetical protein n=1 Tax=Mucilaginibacter sp. L3T2-6 TaxID=3062491 RepID=UPI0026749BF3|nr:hypothetical protein [Mucilaginibacter sp. L3T2-6]MDO3641309.1 hypothetical protein [Mucilaginibacter sp. L3T2-6]MDV6213931.1 hypothetical protein [Mucilaginibacter sp. L3T2-6]